MVTIAGFIRSDINGRWFDGAGNEVTAEQADMLDRLHEERSGRKVEPRCPEHGAYDETNCPLHEGYRLVGSVN